MKFSVYEAITEKTLATFANVYDAENFLAEAKKAHGGYIYRIIIERSDAE